MSFHPLALSRPARLTLATRLCGFPRGFYRCTHGHLLLFREFQGSAPLCRGMVLKDQIFMADPETQAVTLSPTEVIQVNPLQENITAGLCAYLRYTERLLAILGLRSVEERILGALLTWGIHCADPVPQGRQLQFALTQSQLGQITRSNRFMIAQLTSEWEEKGWLIRPNNKQLILTDLKILQKFCPLKFLGNV